MNVYGDVTSSAYILQRTSKSSVLNVRPKGEPVKLASVFELFALGGMAQCYGCELSSSRSS